MYLDVAATAPVRREVLEAMWPALVGPPGNPASNHENGRAARASLDAARRDVAAAFGGWASGVVFTSGGTEGDNLAVKGAALAAPRGRHLVTTAMEHPAVLASVERLVAEHGFAATLVPVGADGVVDPAELRGALRPDTTLVSIGWAQNEVGTVQDIAALAAEARAVGALVHSDAVQAAGAVPVDQRAAGVDLLTVSGHKLGTPQGIGAALVRPGVAVAPLFDGGGQQGGVRSGTEPVALALGLAAAARALPAAEALARRAAVRDLLFAEVAARVPGARITGSASRRLPGHCSWVFPGVHGEALLVDLEARGFVVSSGSACRTGSSAASPVLTALGVSPEAAQSAVRVTFDDTFGADDARAMAAVLAESVAALR